MSRSSFPAALARLWPGPLRPPPLAALIGALGVAVMIGVVMAPWLKDLHTFGFHDWDAETSHRYLAVRIREYAKRKKWSQNQVADFAGLSRSQLSRLVAGKQSPTLATLLKIAAALDVGVRELLPPS